MATNENLIPIPGRLHSVASDEIVSGANEIYDDKLSDNQENLNTGFTNDIDTIYNTIGDDNEKGAIMEQLNTIDGRLDTIDGEISALNSIPIEVVPLNSAGTAPNVNNPQENTLYRAYNSDNTQYSDWMYQDGSWVMITQQLEPTSQEKLVGYYTCNTAANTPGKEVTTENSGYVLPANGGAMKIKMTNANTANNATLKIGSETAKPLWYNDERASSSNTWEEGEVISVYYDGENYKASNAMGGGSAVGKKKLTPLQGYIENNGTTLGAIHTASADKTNYRYIKYPVKEGDVVQISGTGDSAAKLWGIVGEENVMLNAAAASVSATNLILVMPEGTTFITINSKASSNPEWYYAKAGSIGAHEMLTEAYLYGELRNLNAGETYTNNEAVKTTDKQLLRLIKDIQKMNLTDAVAIGDLKVYSTNTYKAQKAIAAYSNATTYSDGDYAIGRPATYLISVDISSMTVSEDTNIQVTIGEETKTITVTSSSTANSIATDIATVFTSIEGWTLTNNENGTLTLRNLVTGVNTITISSEVGETGIVITPTLTAGNLILCQYDESTDAWNTITLANYAADAAEIGEVDATKMWQKVDATWLGTIANGAVKQAVVPKLYEDFGYNNDGALTQKFVTDMLAYEESISFSTFTYINKYCIVNNNTKWAVNNNFGFYYRRVAPGQRIVIKAKDTYATYYAWLAEQDLSSITSSKTIVYAPGYSSHIAIPKGKKVIVDVPAGTVYLYICRYGISSSSKTDRRPEYVHSVNSKINTLDYFKKAEWGEELDLSGYDVPLRWISSNTWTLNTNPSGTAQKSGTRSQLIKLTEGTYTIYADGHDCRYTVVSDNDTTAGNPVQYYEGYTGWKYLLNRMSAQIVVPKDTPCWLLVTHYYDFTNSIDWSHPRLFKRTEYKELIGDIKYSGYDIKDITSGVGNWLSNGTVKFTEEDHGNVKITQTSTYSSTRIGLNLGVIPANCLLRIRFDLSKNTCHSNTAYFVLQQHIDSQDRYETKVLTDINGRRHYMNGPGGHYDFVFNPENWYQIGFSSNFGSFEIVVNNFKLEALIPKSLGKSDQCVSAHSIGTEWLRLLHFSDIHGNGDAAAEIRKFYDKNKSHIDNMLCTGDVMEMNIASSFDFYKLNKLTDALLTIGNHDTAAKGGNTYTTHIPYATQFNTYYKDYIDNWGVVRPENATDECYYYKDYTSKNIRLICLDVMVMNTVVDGGTRNEEQLTWFTNTLADAKENGYTVVVAAHYPPLYTAKHKLGLPIIDEKTGCCTTFSQINTGTQEMREVEGGPLISYDRINGTLAELTTPEQGSWLDERYLTAVDNFIADTGSGKGKFAVWLCGHKHADLLYYAPGHPDILVMAITTTKDYDDTDGVYQKEYPMVANLISINSGFIKVTRIGRNKDRFLRHIGTLTYAYGRRRVIYND